MAASPVPTDASLIREDLLSISWSDGRTLHYHTDHLRGNCPCAQCVPEPGKPREQGPEAYGGVELRSLDEVGNYAFRIAFTDGHDLGIYTWAHLLNLGFRPEEAPASFDV